MQRLLVLTSMLVASTLAASIIPTAYYAQPLPHYSHAQNTLTGEYAYSYTGGPTAKAEAKSIDGITRGSYSYVDANGLIQNVNYVADDNGFHVAGTDIPHQVPQDTPEVAAAKLAHFSEYNKVAASHREKRGILLAPALSVATTKVDTIHNSHAIHHPSPVLHPVQPVLPVVSTYAAAALPIASPILAPTSSIQHSTHLLYEPRPLYALHQPVYALHHQPLYTAYHQALPVASHAATSGHRDGEKTGLQDAKQEAKATESV